MPITSPTRGIIQASAQSAIPFPASQRAAAVNSVAAYLRLLQAQGETRYALAGNGSGVVTVPDRLSHIYCRIGGVGGIVAEARIINVLNPQNDDPILIRRERPSGAGGWLVIDWKGTGSVPITPCLPPITVECRSQALISASSTFGGNAVGARGIHAYVIAASNDVLTENAFLYTVDLSDPEILVVVDTQDIGEPWLTCNLRCNADGSRLWITGVLNDGSDVSDRPRRIQSYDLSNPAAPLFVSAGDTKLVFNWEVYEPGGTPYLVGLDYHVGSATPVPQEFEASPLWVEDGDTFADVGTLVGRFARADSVYGNVRIVQDSAIIGLRSTDALQPDPNLPGALASVDISSPAAPAFLWTDTDLLIMPIARSGVSHFYAGHDPVIPSNNFYYDNATPGAISKQQMEEDDEPPYGIVEIIDGVYYAVFSVGGGFANGSAWDISNPLNTVLISQINCELETLNDLCRVADITKTGLLVYYCSVGRAGDGGLYLNVLTATETP